MNLELTPSVLLAHLHSLLSHSHSTNKSPAIKILVAYSGGLDSHVLLHLLSKVSSNDVNIRAIYINHGLQAESNAWAHHCENICKTLDVEFKSINLELSVPKGESIEEVARNFRYQTLTENILDDEILVTAHHQNDQAETLLLQLFRGAGVQGLASMPEINTFNSSKSMHLRPLLGFARNTLEAYANKFDLKHIEDPSNKDTSFDRNFLRREIMPKLRDRWLGIDKTISRAANIQAETKRLLDELASDELPNVLTKETYFVEDLIPLSLAPINISELRELSPSKQRLLLRYWISQQGFINPSDTKLTHIFNNLIDAADNKQPLIEWSGVELRRYQNCLYIMPPLSNHDSKQVFNWNINIKDKLEVESLGITLDSKVLPAEMIVSQKDLSVRFRQGGERIEIPKRGSISLKNFLQEQHVPAWIRPRLPLIYLDDKLKKVIGLDDYKRHPPTF